jgi:hypothetical protein
VLPNLSAEDTWALEGAEEDMKHSVRLITATWPPVLSGMHENTNTNIRTQT